MTNKIPIKDIWGATGSAGRIDISAFIMVELIVGDVLSKLPGKNGGTSSLMMPKIATVCFIRAFACLKK